MQTLNCFCEPEIAIDWKHSDIKNGFRGENIHTNVITLKTRQAVFSRVNFFFKRTLDIFVSLIGLFLLMPLFGIISYLIWLDTRGSIIYKQIRIGRDRRLRKNKIILKYFFNENERRFKESSGRPFNLYKFRTMYSDAERLSGPVWAKENDPRITRFGKWLRKMRLDELPQLWNILKGDMSLVGPRPERPFFIDQYREKIHSYNSRFWVLPGITGLAQIYNGYDMTMASVQRKINYDIKYIKTFSFISDLKILIKTIPVVLKGKGAH